MSKTTKTATTAKKTTAAAAMAPTPASKPSNAPATTATTPLNAETAMQAIAEFARTHGNGWRGELRAIWGGADNGTDLYAARSFVPVALLDNLAFKPQRMPKPLTPEQEAARRLRRVGTAMRAKAKTLLVRAKEVHAQARAIKKGERALPDHTAMTALEAEVGM